MLRLLINQHLQEAMVQEATFLMNQHLQEAMVQGICRRQWYRRAFARGNGTGDNITSFGEQHLQKAMVQERIIICRRQWYRRGLLMNHQLQEAMVQETT